MDLQGLQAWTDRYVAAWRANDRQEIGSLFAEDAKYFTHPFRKPWRGREAIVRNWTRHPDPPETWSCDYRAIAVGGDTGVVRGRTTYLNPDGSVETEYSNVFVVEFDPEGNATEFTEWFMASNPAPRGDS